MMGYEILEITLNKLISLKILIHIVIYRLTNYQSDCYEIIMRFLYVFDWIIKLLRVISTCFILLL